jgi:AhpD family alkylhydroperoxidase
MDDATGQSRLHQVDPQHAAGKTRQLFGQVQAKFGFLPNLLRMLANAPVALDGYTNFSAALAGGTLDAKVREQVALAVAESNLCAYCLTAHTATSAKIGLSKVEIDDAIRARAADARPMPFSNLRAVSSFSAGNSPMETSRAPVLPA